METKMTPTKLSKLSMSVLKRLAYEYNMVVLRDYTKQDIIDVFIDRMGEDEVAWILLAGVVEQVR
jgi:hypothetical protein